MSGPAPSCPACSRACRASGKGRGLSRSLLETLQPGSLPGVEAFGSRAHRAIIEQIVAHYQDDDRVLAVAVFGSIATGAWHELSDVDLDVVTSDGVVMRPADEVVALFGPRAVITLTGDDSADVVLNSLEEVSIRWHPLRTTSPNIATSVRVVHDKLSDAELAAAGDANRVRPDEQQLLDALARDAVGASKSLRRGRRWEAAAAIERMRRSLTDLRGSRDALQLDPADPASALTTVIAEARAAYDLGTHRLAVLDLIDPSGRDGLPPGSARP